jgi:hypothetical protein
MSPFLARLPGLNPAERALAVHLGVFPGDGRTGPPATYAANGAVSPGSVTDAGRPDTGQASLARRNPAPEPVSTEPRRRPGSDSFAAAVRTPKAEPRAEEPKRPAGGTGSSGVSAWDLARGTIARPKAKAEESKPPQEKTQPAKLDPQPTRLAEREPEPAPAVMAPSKQPEPASEFPPGDAADRPIQTAELEPSSVAVPAEAEARTALPEPKTPATSRLADIAAVVATIPEAEKPAPQPAKRAAPTPTRLASAAAKKPPAAPPAAAKPKKEAPEPSRHWVQVAGGADKAALPREFTRLKGKAPKLLGARSAWTVPLNATNRLLVGPFASAKEAQAFVNQLKEADLTAFAWTSPAGQKVEKLPAK